MEGTESTDNALKKKKYTYVYTCSILLKSDTVVKPFHCDTLYLYGAWSNFDSIDKNK